MSTFKTVRNPLLEDKEQGFRESTISFRSFIHQSHLKLSNRFTHSSRKVVPTSSKERKKKVSSSVRLTPHIKQQEQSEPYVHYNGPFETLDQLPKEKLDWVTQETSNSKELRHPLLDYPRSIVLRKPHYKSSSMLGHHHHHSSNLMKPKATFYIRVLQVINQNSSKSCLLRSSIQLNDQLFEGSFAVSQKCGKNGSQANLDETYILDVEKPSTTTLSIYAQPKTTLGALNSRFRQPEICLGRQVFKIPMRPTEKKLKRITIQDAEGNNQYQVLVVYGTFVSSRRWARYWAALYPGHIELYDFEYKERRKALYKISIKALLDVFHPPTDDDERLVDVGSLGLALQFSHESLSKENSMNPDFEYRMYILPDDHERSQEWEQSLMHAASLINEFRYDESYIATKVNNNNEFKLEAPANEDTNCPTESTLGLYLDEFIKYNVSTVVRCCQPTYNSQQLISKGISVVDLPFKDGGIPPDNIIHDWLHILQNASNTTIAVHCVAGLGRAPVLVAIALIELGMAPLDAIQFIREKRRGSFNKPQITFLDGYRRKKPTHSQYSFRSSFGKMFGFGPKTVSQQT
ncbi:hypothetical protein [Parasitella parasitica]|uniref:protein-tyrosine-phosphatase n=1 Tax=Parasitella parasitica TaxID=35722 RepID=A0A0B7NNQ3_9FUNG|nr:hypothetical protein [Parasitella parasitica]